MGVLDMGEKRGKKEYEHVAVGFPFTSDWMRKW